MASMYAPHRGDAIPDSAPNGRSTAEAIDALMAPYADAERLMLRLRREGLGPDRDILEPLAGGRVADPYELAYKAARGNGVSIRIVPATVGSDGDLLDADARWAWCATRALHPDVRCDLRLIDADGKRWLFWRMPTAVRLGSRSDRRRLAQTNLAYARLYGADPESVRLYAAIAIPAMLVNSRMSGRGVCAATRAGSTTMRLPLSSEESADAR